MNSRGFTLLEMLVALAVMAVLGALAWGSLDVLAEKQQALEARAEQWQRLTLAQALLEQDIRHARIRGARDAQGRRLPVLMLQGQQLQWTRGGVWDRRGEPGHLQRVFWNFQGAHPMRAAWPVADAAAGVAAQKTLEVEPVTAMQVWLLDEQGRWQDRWPLPGQAEDAFPRAIRVRWHSPRFGDMQWQWHWGLTRPDWPVQNTPPGAPDHAS